MLTAGEAKQIMNDVNRYKDELKDIESYIIEAAKEGKSHVTLIPFIPYSVRTIDGLRALGYKVTLFKGYKSCNFSYCIEWAEEE